MTMSGYMDKNNITHKIPSALPSVAQNPPYGNTESLPKASSSTMMGKYNQPIPKARKKIGRRPQMVVKNGKLLISSKRTIS